jgi:hypothetical protein
MRIRTLVTRHTGTLVTLGVIVGAAVTPVAVADTDPLVPYGTNPQVSVPTGLHTSNHDETDTTTGRVDLPF